LMTSCEAVFAEPSIAVRYTGSEAGNSYGEQLRHTGQEWWKTIERFIDQKAPFNLYGKVIKIVVSLCPVAFILLLFPSYWRLPKEILTKVREDEFFPVFLIFFGGLFGLSAWAFSEIGRASC